MEIDNNSTSFLEELLSSRTQILESKEYGASKLAQLMIGQLGLDKVLSSDKKNWAEDVLLLITKKMIRTTNDQICPYKDFLRDSLHKSLAKLMSKKECIEKQLALKHAKERAAYFIDLTSWGLPSGPHDFQGGLLTNEEGCPFAIVTFLENGGGFHDQIKTIMDNYNLKSLLSISNFHGAEVENAEFIARTPCTQAYYQSKRAFINIILESDVRKDLPLNALLLVGLLIAYVEWHMSKKLDDYLSIHGKSGLWTLGDVFEKLKSIRSQSIQVGAKQVYEVKTDLDAEQKEIIAAFGFTSNEFLMP